MKRRILFLYGYLFFKHVTVFIDAGLFKPGDIVKMKNGPYSDLIVLKELKGSHYDWSYKYKVADWTTADFWEMVWDIRAKLNFFGLVLIYYPILLPLFVVSELLGNIVLLISKLFTK